MKNSMRSVLCASVVALGLLAPAASAQAADLGGWSETSGNFTLASDSTAQSTFAAAAAASPNHRGASEEKVINGTTNKRSHGWTTWAGTYHYTTARLESYSGSRVIATSGRKWGTGGTEAVTVYKPFQPNEPDNGNGIARTYYGR